MYYQHSGRFSFGRLVAGTFGACLFTFLFAWAYAYAILYIPLAGYVTFILMGGYAFLVGLCAGFGAQFGKVRNGLVSGLTGLGVAFFALWLAWVCWTYALLRRGEVEDVSFLDLLANPFGLWNVILLINEKGAWSLKGSTPTGVVLWLLWGVEAAVILAIPPLAAIGMNGGPFCESCDEWCTEKKDLARLVATTPDEVKARLESRDFAYLGSLGLAPPDAQRWVRVNAHACEKCQETNTLTIEEVAVSVNQKGEKSENTTAWVSDLILTGLEAEKVRGTLAALKTPEAPPAA